MKGARTSNSRILSSAAAFALTFSLFSILHIRVEPPVLLAERFFPGTGWWEGLALSLYAAGVVWLLSDIRRAPSVRSFVWVLFSVVFFLQLLFGLLGIKRCLMTGELHLPVPAMIMAGPLFRGEGVFMPLLFVATVLLVGPAWCSYLCYIGSWDHLASGSKVRPKERPQAWKHVRVLIFLLIIILPLALRWGGVMSGMATGLGLAFGILGILVIAFVSRKTGMMVHCTVYCPIGVAADLLGRLSPFRVRFSGDCDGCRACRPCCRYDALTSADIQARRPGFSCSLCGDCLKGCPKGALGFGFLGLSPEKARSVFLVMIGSLHAVFLGMARI
ncbi:MAG: 4Fe-4S binding protein [Candidatus Aminicenantales bacterium]